MKPNNAAEQASFLWPFAQPGERAGVRGNARRPFWGARNWQLSKLNIECIGIGRPTRVIAASLRRQAAGDELADLRLLALGEQQRGLGRVGGDGGLDAIPGEQREVFVGGVLGMGE